MRVAIIGSREKLWPHPEWAKRSVERYVNLFLAKGDVLVSGGANGVDSWAAEAAIRAGIEVVEHKPDYAQYGKGATFRRNATIVHDCGKLIAFWNGESRGTQHTIDYAQRQWLELGVPVVMVVEPEKHIPEWWLEPSDYAF